MIRRPDGMGCELSEGEIFVLEILRKDKCFSSDRGYHHDKLKKWYLKKKRKTKWDMDYDDCIHDLLNRGIIAKIGKSPPKYYICNIKAMAMALTKCGIDIRPGRYHPLML